MSWRHGGKPEGDVLRAALSAQSKTVFCAYTRASPQNSDKGWCFETTVQSQYINLTAVSKLIDRSCQHTYLALIADVA